MHRDAFAALSEAEQSARLAVLARRALGAWGLADAEVALIKYRENAVFRVTPSDGPRCVVRVHRPAYRSDAQIRAEAAWMRALDQTGVPTPTVLPTRNGDALTIAAVDEVPEPRQCDLLAWVDGEPLGTLEGGVDLDADALHERYATIGALAARIHAHGEAWTRPAGFTRPAWNAETLVGDEPTFGRFWELDLDAAHRTTLLAARDRAREALAALGPATLLIHGDLIPDNVLVHTGEARVIDFDDCGWSWCAFELVTSVFPLLISGGYEAGLAGYLDGYRRERRVPDAELAAVPALLIARALSYLGWPAGRPEIHSQRELVPLFAAGATELAEAYLRDAL